MSDSPAPKLTPQDIANLIKGLGGFLFMPNDGNYGDLLIAEGIRDFFRKQGIAYEELLPDSLPESYNLVYGGGGIFVKQWISCVDTRLITGPQVNRCILLPCSIREVDDFVDGLDERHTVLCREEETYRYCTGRNKRACFLMADDMALQLDLEALMDATPAPAAANPIGSKDEEKARGILQNGFARRIRRIVERATVTSALGGRKQRVAFILRTDSEAAAPLETPWSTDISGMYNATCYAHKYNKTLLRIMADSLAETDAVVSNRLHVCIMAHLLGKEVYMLDNCYGKLAGVYRASLSHCVNVHYLGTAPLPPDLQKAHAGFMALPKRWDYRAISMYHRVKGLAGRLSGVFRLR